MHLLQQLRWMVSAFYITFLQFRRLKQTCFDHLSCICLASVILSSSVIRLSRIIYECYFVYDQFCCDYNLSNPFVRRVHLLWISPEKKPLTATPVHFNFISLSKSWDTLHNLLGRKYKPQSYLFTDRRATAVGSSTDGYVECLIVGVVSLAFMPLY